MGTSAGYIMTIASPRGTGRYPRERERERERFVVLPGKSVFFLYRSASGDLRAAGV